MCAESRWTEERITGMTEVEFQSSESVQWTVRPAAGEALHPTVAPNGRIGVLLLASSLERGGAERQVVHLANCLDRQRFDVHVCSLSRRLDLADGLIERDRVLHVLEKHGRFDASLPIRLARFLRRLRCQLVHAFLFDAEMTARLASMLVPSIAILGSERNADYHVRWLHKWSLRLTRRWADATIANSDAGVRFAIQTGRSLPNRTFLVRNGVDVVRFAPMGSPKTRRQLGGKAGEFVVGMVANFKPQKNHLMFFRVARRVLDRIPNVRFVCVGERLETVDRGLASWRSGCGIPDAAAYHERMRSAIRESGLADRVFIAGACEDMPGFYNACSLIVSTSMHEGTPNVLLESMACGVPVVATDVADNAFVLGAGQGGVVVALDDVEAMAAQICGLLLDQERRAALGASARRWVESEFSLQSLADRTAAVYETILLGRSACRIA